MFPHLTCKGKNIYMSVTELEKKGQLMKCSSWQNTWPSQIERNLAFQFVYRKWSSSRFIKVTALFPFLQVLEAQGHRTHNTYKRSLRFSMRSWHLTENPAHVVQMMLTCTRYYQNMENRKILGAFVNIFRSKDKKFLILSTSSWRICPNWWLQHGERLQNEH